MSSRSKKKNRLLLLQKKEKALELKLQELNLKLEEQKKETQKQRMKRNIKYITSTGNLLAPFIITAGITIGLFKVCGIGYPFHIDQIKKYRIYDLELDTEKQTTLEEEYVKFGLLDDTPANSLEIISPWEEQERQKIRYKRTYQITTLDSPDLINSLLDGNYDYIQNLYDYEEEIQTINKLNKENQNNYQIQASLHWLDERDSISIPETNLKNIITTIIELLITFGIGSGITYKREFNYIRTISQADKDYEESLRMLNYTNEQIEETNQLILSLSKKKGKKQQ